jgi:hypothetical protein
VGRKYSQCHSGGTISPGGSRSNVAASADNGQAVIRTLEQLESYLPALDYAFTADDEALVDELVPAGHPSTPGFNDPAYPIEGRQTWTAAHG